MGNYAYKATDPSGRLIKGAIEAGDEREAVGRLQEMGYIPIRILPAGSKSGGLLGEWQHRVLSLFS